MLFPEKSKKFRKIPLDKKFWRGRASSSTTTIFQSVPCASISARANFVKSFLQVWAKLFLLLMVFWRRRAYYSAKAIRCQVFLPPKAQIF